MSWEIDMRRRLPLDPDELAPGDLDPDDFVLTSRTIRSDFTKKNTFRLFFGGQADFPDYLPYACAGDGDQVTMTRVAERSWEIETQGEHEVCLSQKFAACRG